MGVCSVSLLVFRWFGDLVGWGLVYDYLNCSFGVASCLLVVVLIWLLVGGCCWVFVYGGYGYFCIVLLGSLCLCG